MYELEQKKIAVIGLDPSGLAACRFAREAGARVWAVASDNAGTSQKETEALSALGIPVVGPNELPSGLQIAVHSAQTSPRTPLVRELADRGVQIMSDLELGSRAYCCLSIGISGTNGKTTVAELIAAMLQEAQRKTVRAGASGTPICDVTSETRELDFLTLDLNSFQLETIENYRPAVAVITNIRGDHMDRYPNKDEFARAMGRIFKNQQVFDWAIVQSEALAHLRSLEIPIPSKLITFSARNRRADIFLDRGLLISSLPNWTGPLFNMDQCALRGPHNAENVMAALAAGRVLHLQLEEMAAAIRNYKPGRHRLELVAEIEGVKFIDNSKAMNVDAVEQSIEAIPSGRGGEPNVWLIAGGRDKGLDYHDLGPLLASRVKGAFLLGETREKLRAAWSLFTPCSMVETLLEAVTRAAEHAVPGDVVLLSPACSSLDMFQSYQDRGEKFKQAVESLPNPADFDTSLATAEADSGH